MALRCYEDFSIGEVVEAGPLLVTAEAIQAFAAEFDPQPMHLDGGAQNTVVDGLFASGLHTVCLNMRLLVDNFLRAPGSKKSAISRRCAPATVSPCGSKSSTSARRRAGRISASSNLRARCATPP